MLSIVKLASAFRSKELKPSIVTLKLLNDIKLSNLNSFISLNHSEALNQAKIADQSFQDNKAVSLLHGVPIAVKDLIDVEGCRSTMGAEQYAEQSYATSDAIIIARLRQAGAVILGKTNTHEFAYGSTGDRSFFGAVKNPINPLHITGGSSSGSSAALCAELCAGSLGTDTSGSIRLPAALCGVVGMKPTFQLLPTEGIFPLSHTLDHAGPLTSSVEDNAVLLAVLAGQPENKYTQKIGQSPLGLKIGVVKSFYGEYISTTVQTEFNNAIRKLEGFGIKIIEIDIDSIQKIYDKQQIILKSEAFSQHKVAIHNDAPFQAEVKARLLTGQNVMAVDYIEAKAYKKEAVAAFEKAFQSVDVIITPTCGITAPLIDDRMSEVNGQSYPTMWLLTRLTAPTNFTGHPSLSVPIGVDQNGLPVAMQLIGRQHDEQTLYQVGALLESVSL
jgi:aspartyl-tRNA(Asn)/glutamyl-tRNA(Gln) amidotransferase subunit A